MLGLNLIHVTKRGHCSSALNDLIQCWFIGDKWDPINKISVMARTIWSIWQCLLGETESIDSRLSLLILCKVSHFTKELHPGYWLCKILHFIMKFSLSGMLQGEKTKQIPILDWTLVLKLEYYGRNSSILSPDFLHGQQPWFSQNKSWYFALCCWKIGPEQISIELYNCNFILKLSIWYLDVEF